MNIRMPAKRLCLFFISAALICLSCSGQQTEILTAQERSWLDAHRHDIAVVQDRYYAPYEFCLRDSDIVQGMMYDYMSLIEKKLNVRFSRRSPRDLSTNLEIMKQRDAAVINAVTKTPERSAYLLFTDPVIEMRNVILVRKEYKGDIVIHAMPKDPSFSISTVADYSITKHLQREYPSYHYDIVSSDLKALLNVSYGISGAAVVDLATASYLCEKEGISNLRVAGDVGRSNMLAIGSRSDWPELNIILNKAVKNISADEQDDIYKRWISIEDTRIWKNKTFRIVIISLGGFSLIVVCLVLLWNRQLSFLVRKKTGELTESEERFRLLVEQAPEAIVLLDADRDRLVEVNGNAEVLFGCSRNTLLDSGLKKFYPMMRDDVLSLTDSGKKNASVAANEISMSEREIRTSDGRDLVCEVHLSLFPSSAKRLIRASFIDITERRLSEQRLQNSLEEKETLLRELYHRTKNNMQVINSLLRLHSDSLSDGDALRFVLDMQNRILAMSLAHQKLYHSKNLSRINLHEYIHELTEQSLGMYISAPDRITFSLSIADEYLAIDAAIPLGLILSELLIHSYRQSFSGERKGEIRIQLMRNESGEIELSYADDGAGISDGLSPAENGTLGMKTVCALGADQLKGRVTFPPGNGFHFLLIFNDAMFKPRV